MLPLNDILKHESLSNNKAFYWATGKKINEVTFYEVGNELRYNFINSKGVQMHWYFYWVAPKDFTPYLIEGTRFSAC
jgi:hypothetical protein